MRINNRIHIYIIKYEIIRMIDLCNEHKKQVAAKSAFEQMLTSNENRFQPNEWGIQL